MHYHQWTFSAESSGKKIHLVLDGLHYAELDESLN